MRAYIHMRLFSRQIALSRIRNVLGISDSLHVAGHRCLQEQISEAQPLMCFWIIVSAVFQDWQS